MSAIHTAYVTILNIKSTKIIYLFILGLLISRRASVFMLGQIFGRCDRGLSGRKKKNVRRGTSSSLLSSFPIPLNACSSLTYPNTTTISPQAPRILNSISSPHSPSGDRGRSNSIPVKGKRRHSRRPVTWQDPWIGREEADIGIRMNIVANPS